MAAGAAGPLSGIRTRIGPRSVQVALAVSTLTSLALFASPLTALHGVENALVHGLVLPPFVAAMAARLAARRYGEAASTPSSLGRETARAAALVLAPAALLPLAAALVYRWCSPLESGAFFLLGPVAGVGLAALLGLALGLHLPARAAAILAPSVVVAVDLVEASRIVTTPAIFVYGHFAGHFPGTLYDPDVAIGGTYLSFRGASLVWAIALACLVLVTGRRRLVVAALAAAAGLALGAYGPELGHRSTVASITEALGGTQAGERCTIVFPRELPRDRAARLLRDCEFRVRRTEEVLGLTHPERITAFFFRSEDEKRRLMGASGTYVAKPWRDEVYLQLGSWPHPVLHHELVHVVAGATGIGPFRIAGALFGLLPAPGIIEGLAVAIAWDESEGLTPHEWAAALARIGHAPSIEATTGLAFLLQPASRAYTANGSFMRWILETRGSAAVRRIYREGDYARALETPIAALERDWHAFLLTLPLPPEAEGLARLRFERASIWSQVCPRAIALLENDLGAAMAAGDDAAALGDCDAILAIDPGHASVLGHRVGALARLGRTEDAEAALAALVGRAPSPIVGFARSALAEAAWQHGDAEAALRAYRENIEGPLTDDARRQLEVQLLALEAGGAESAALGEVFAPRSDRSHDAATTLSAIARLREARTDGLADYLEARQLAARERFDLAHPLLLRAERLGLPTERTARENRRLLGVAALEVGRAEDARAIFGALLAAARTDGERVEAEDWLARVRLNR